MILPTEVVDSLKTVARRINQIESDLRDTERQSSAAFSSVEADDDLVTYYDAAGVERMEIGLQDDGTFAIHHMNGPTPPQPESPDCYPVDAGVLVVYDGTFVDAAAPADLAYYEVHASATAGYTASDETLVGSMGSPDGGNFVHGTATIHAVAYYSIVAVSLSGARSPKSEEVLGRSGGILGYQDRLVVTTPGDQTLHLSFHAIPDSTIHLYWNGVEQPDDTWSIADGWIMTIYNSSSLIVAGDVFNVKYLYRDPEVYVPPAPGIFYVASRHDDSGSGTLALPPGTVAGDLVVVAIVARSDDASGVVCTDSRLAHTYRGTVAGGNANKFFLGYFIEDGSGSNISYTLPVSYSSDTRAQMSTFRYTGTLSVTDVPGTVGPILAPTMPTGKAAGVIAITGETGVVPAPIAPDSTGHWTIVSFANHSGNTAFGSSTQMSYDTAGCRSGSWNGDTMAAMIVGIA